MKLSGIGATTALVSVASGYTIFCQLKTSEETYPVAYGVRAPTSNYPITDLNSANLTCNGGRYSETGTPTDKVINVKAGETVTAIWRATLESGPDDVIGQGYRGPILAYLKKVADATTDDGVGDGWFKVQEEGIRDGKWGTDSLRESGGNQEIKIPECIEDGQYLLRAEAISLSSSHTRGNSYIWLECAQINITGGKGSKKPPTVEIPGVYKYNDPGLLIDIDSGYNRPYQIPGPPVFTC